jgi:hypothetical protein
MIFSLVVKTTEKNPNNVLIENFFDRRVTGIENSLSHRVTRIRNFPKSPCDENL